MGQLSQLFTHLNPLNAAAMVLLVLAMIVVIKIGKVLILAGILGALAGGVSLGQGHPPAAAATHAAIGFGIAALALFLIKVTKVVAVGLVITAIGLAVLLLSGVGR